MHGCPYWDSFKMNCDKTKTNMRGIYQEVDGNFIVMRTWKNIEYHSETTECLVVEREKSFKSIRMLNIKQSSSKPFQMKMKKLFLHFHLNLSHQSFGSCK